MVKKQKNQNVSGSVTAPDAQSTASAAKLNVIPSTPQMSGPGCDGSGAPKTGGGSTAKPKNFNLKNDGSGPGDGGEALTLTLIL